MARDIDRAFKGRLRTGVIVRNVAGALDGHGRPSGAVPIGAAVRCFVDDFSQFYKASAGINATDMRVNLFGASIEGLQPRKDDRVRIDYPAANGLPARSQWYQLRGATVDPANALWQCTAYEIQTGPSNYQVDLAALLAALADAANGGL